VSTKQFRLTLSALVTVAILTFASVQTTHAQSLGTGTFQPKFAKYMTLHPNAKQLAAARHSHLLTTIPFWSSLFTFQGNEYPYQMVGTDPTTGSATTVVPTELIGLKLTFADGFVLDGSTKLKPTLNSPIFSKADFKSGHTQYGDAIQRAEFWTYVQKYSKGYHVLLGHPRVSTISLIVPAQNGLHVKTPSGIDLGLMEINWFDSVLQGIMAAKHISPSTFPIFLDYNAFLYIGNPSQCCILGYHSALPFNKPNGTSAIQTYAFAAYGDPGLSSPSFTASDIVSLSHEVSEWYNDPFTDNIVPPWASPLAPQYGCSNLLEVGDPVAGVAFEVNGYHPEDEVFFSWFARQVPSLGIHGLYTYLGTFNTVPPVCQ
jgi:hypothetical protein